MDTLLTWFANDPGVPEPSVPASEYGNVDAEFVDVDQHSPAPIVFGVYLEEGSPRPRVRILRPGPGDDAAASAWHEPASESSHLQRR